ncbi:MAG: urease accessory protein UreD, partial [Rubrobacteraceae bacterium]
LPHPLRPGGVVGASVGGLRLRLETLPGVARPGRSGSLRLAFEVRDGKTALTGRYASAPFGAVKAGYPDAAGTAEVQITNPAGGVLGGDLLETEVSLASGSAATILTQGATKAYRGDPAGQSATFDLGHGTLLEYLPHHSIPYSGSNFRQTFEFRLAGDSTLICWESFAAGRVARGERFGYGSLSSRTRIFREGTPLVVDGFELSGGGEPGGEEPFGGYSYFGSVYVLAPLDLAPLAERLHGALGGSGSLASATAPSFGLCAARILSPKAPDLYHRLNACRANARSFLGLPPSPREVW